MDINDLRSLDKYYTEKADAFEMHYNMQPKVRREVLNELWAAPKVNHEGHWYVKLKDVVNIIGDYDELYENESKSKS